MSTRPARNEAPVETNGSSEPQYKEKRLNPRVSVVVTLQLCVTLPGAADPILFKGATRSISSAGATIVLTDCPPDVFEELSKGQVVQLLPMFTGPLEGIVNGTWTDPPENAETQTPRRCLSLKLQNATWLTPDADPSSPASE